MEIDNTLSVYKFKKSQVIEEIEECEHKSFGIIKLKPKALNISKVPLHIILTVDVSYSMEEQCIYKKKSYTKLDYVKATLKSIFNYLKKEYNDRDILISLISFSEEAEVIEQFIELKNTDLQYLITLVDKLEADGCTNIYDALKKASNLYNELEEYIILNYDLKIKYKLDSFKNVNILLTDGEVTAGNDNPIILSEMARPQYIELQLLGYGEDHDSKLLKMLEKETKGEYRFVDSFESAGAVYGDVLSSILHPAWKDVNIIIENGLIYDYHENKWKASIHIPQIGDECEKVLSCRLFDNPRVLISYIDITGERGFISNKVSNLVSNSEENSLKETDNIELRCYWLRHLTLELMNEVFSNNEKTSDISHNKRGLFQTPRRDMNRISNNDKNNTVLLEKVTKLLNNINKFEVKMGISLPEKYQEMMKDLKDDLLIAKKCIEDKNQSSDMYLYSRIASQGGQRAYNTNMNMNINDHNNLQVQFDNTYSNSLRSQVNTVRQQNRVSSYASPHAQRVMSQVSQLSQDILSESMD